MNGVGAVIEAIQEKYREQLEGRARKAGVSPVIQEQLDQDSHDRKKKQRRLAHAAGARHDALRQSGATLPQKDINKIASGDFDQNKLISLCTWFTMGQEEKTFLFLCGPNGVGKTFAAACAVARVEHGVFVRSPRLPQATDPWGKEDHRRINTRRERLVVLEELGNENPDNSRWKQAWFEFVDDRQGHGHTIVTTNLNPIQLKARFEPKVRDRLAQCSRIEECVGSSMRRQLW